MKEVEFLVIDEAAQLKECESAIPLQLLGLKRCILIGDEKQLPAMVKSKVNYFMSFVYSCVKF
jgi:senataxin